MLPKVNSFALISLGFAMMIFKVTLHHLLFSIPHNLVYVIFAIGINEEGNSLIFLHYI